MRHIIALVTLATALISTPAFPAWETDYRTDNLTRLTHPIGLHVDGRLTHDGSPDENYTSTSAIEYHCKTQAFSLSGSTTHIGMPELDVAPEFGTLRGVFDGPNRPVKKVEQIKFFGAVERDFSNSNENVIIWLVTVSGHRLLTVGLFEKIKTGEVTSIRIEFPTESGGLVFEYDTDNFPADACEG